MIINLIKGLYIVYILVFFKTKYSFHHPFEIFLQHNNTLDIFRHPIYNSKIYQNKVCFLGHIMAYCLFIWFLVKTYFIQNLLISKFCNKLLWCILMIVSLILNPNVFIYLLPIFIIEVIE